MKNKFHGAVLFGAALIALVVIGCGKPEVRSTKALQQSMKQAGFEGNYNRPNFLVKQVIRVFEVDDYLIYTEKDSELVAAYVRMTSADILQTNEVDTEQISEILSIALTAMNEEALANESAYDEETIAQAQAISENISTMVDNMRINEDYIMLVNNADGSEQLASMFSEF